MKKLFTIAMILSISLAFLPSCDMSGHSLNEFRVNIATVEPLGGGSFALLLDDGRRLWPAASAVRYFPRENQRVLLNFTILSDRHGEFDHLIRINDIWNVLTKQVVELTTENAEKIGDDPVIINQMWEGGGFLNVSFQFNWGGTRPHYINLVKNTTVESTSDDVIELEFRHNAYGSTRPFNRNGLVSFDLRPFQVEGQEEVMFLIRVNEPSGERIIEVVYRYNQATQETMEEFPIPVITSDEVY